MRLHLFFLPNFLRATFTQGATFIPESRVIGKMWKKGWLMIFATCTPLNLPEVYRLNLKCTVHHLGAVNKLCRLKIGDF